MGFTRRTSSVSQTIAVCGIDRNSGTTCLSLGLANYLCSKLGLSIAYVELNGTREIAQLHSGKNRTVFKHLGIDFFPEVTLRDLSDLLQLQYDYFILDMGVLNSYTSSEFYRCNFHFVCGYVSPWKSQRYERFIQQNFADEAHQSNLIFLGNLGTKELLKPMNHRYHIQTEVFPYLNNPFQLTSDDWAFFENLLEKLNIPRIFSR